MHNLFMATLLSLFTSLSWASPPQPTLILPAGPGSTLDLVGRTLATASVRLTGTDMIPLNRPGADGILSVDHLMKNPNSLLLGNTTIHAFNYHFRDTAVNYNDRDFEHISFIGWAPQIWYASKKSRIQNLKDLQNAITSNNILNIAGDNTLNFVNIDAVLKHYQSNHHVKVRYKSAIAAVVDTTSGVIDLAVGTLTPTLVQMANEGRITILASSADSAYQSQGLSVPSLKEQLNIVQFSGGYILSVSTDMEPSQKDTAKKNLARIMQDQSTVESLRNLGVIVVSNKTKNAKQIINEYRDAIASYR